VTNRAAGLLTSAALCLSVVLANFTAAEEAEADIYQLNKNFDDLTPAEKTLAKATAKTKKLVALRVCGDPGNMPLSNQKLEGYENKIVAVLAKAMDTKV